MIVLDSLSQYLKYEIEPPKNMSFHKTYLKVMEQMKRKKNDKLDNQMEFVRSLWQRRIDWWQVCSYIFYIIIFIS